MSADRPMRVLVLSPWEPWPLDHGGRLRLHHLLAQLARTERVTLALSHRPRFPERLPPTVAFVAPSTDPDVPPARTATRPGCWVARRAAQHFGRSESLAAWLGTHARRSAFDVVLCVGTAFGQYVDSVAAPVVWDLIDDPVLALRGAACARTPGGWLHRLCRSALYAAYVRHVARRAAVVICSSSVDAAALRRRCRSARVEVVSNGVDLEYFAPRPAPAAREPVVAFVGALDYPPNVDGITRFARGVWPAVRARRPEARLLIVGRRPGPKVRALATVAGVRVESDVADVRPFLAAARVVVVPVRRGTGVKNKVLEACAMARPVVAHPNALAGLDARPGLELLSARRRGEWVARVCRLLDDDAGAGALGDAGRAWVERAHRWGGAAERLRAALRAAARVERAPDCGAAGQVIEAESAPGRAVAGRGAPCR